MSPIRLSRECRSEGGEGILMGKTYRSWQKRTPGWQKERHSEQRKKHFGERKDRFHFDPRKEYDR